MWLKIHKKTRFYVFINLLGVEYKEYGEAGNEETWVLLRLCLVF